MTKLDQRWQCPLWRNRCNSRVERDRPLEAEESLGFRNCLLQTGHSLTQTDGRQSGIESGEVANSNWPEDRGRKRFPPSPPSEPGVRFSRDGLSSQLFPHRDWRAN